MSGEESSEPEFHSEATCCAAKCGKLGEFSVGGRFWLVTDELCHGKPCEFVTGLVACAEHKENMPSTCEAFLTFDWRAGLTAMVRATGRAAPNYKSAQWVFVPIEKPPTEAAH